MDLFRYSRNVYGQSTLEGVAFELVFVFAGAAALIIVAHLLFKLATGKRARNDNHSNTSNGNSPP